MKKRLLSLFVILAMIIGTITVPPQSAKAGGVTGTGTKDDPYVVTTFPDMKNYLTQGYVKLGADISAVSCYTSNSVSTEGYEGGLDFNGHIIDMSTANDYSEILSISSDCGENAKFTVSDSNKEATHVNGPTDVNGDPIKGGILCNANHFGGLVEMSCGSLYVDGGTFVDNDFGSSSALFKFQNVSTQNPQINDVVVENVTFLRNTSTTAGAWSSFVMFYDSAKKANSLVLRNVNCYQNVSNATAIIGGYGFPVDNAIIENCVMNDNTCNYYGIINFAPKVLTLKNVSLQGNKKAEVPESYQYVAGIDYSRAGKVILDGKIYIQDNYYEDTQGNREIRNQPAVSSSKIEFADTFDMVNSRIGVCVYNPTSYNNLTTDIADGLSYKDCFTVDQADKGMYIKTVEGQSKVYLAGPTTYTLDFLRVSDTQCN